MSKKPIGVPIFNLEREIFPGLHIRHVENMQHERPPLMMPHRDDYFVFLYQQSGQSIFSIDLKEVVLEDSCICCIIPGSVHRFVSAVNLSGWMLAASPELIDEVIRRILLDSDPGAVFPLNGKATYLNEIACAIAGYQSHQGNLGQLIVTPLMSAFASIFAEIIETNQKRALGNRSAVVTSEFNKILRQNFKIQKAPSWYAEKLNISLSYLNECVKTSTGIAVSLHIQQEIALEAKRQLAHTNLSIKEVAYLLGYTDPAYFNRVFLKVVGERPAVYRKKYHK